MVSCLSVKGVIYLLIPVCRHCHKLRFRKTKFLFHVKVKVAAVSTLNQMNARNIAPHSVQQQHLKIMKQKNCMINARAPKWQENRPCALGLSNKSQIVMIISVSRRAAHYVTSCTNCEILSCLRFSLQHLICFVTNSYPVHILSKGFPWPNRLLLPLLLLLYEVRCLKSNEDMILALTGQFKQLSHEPEKFRRLNGIRTHDLCDAGAVL